MASRPYYGKVLFDIVLKNGYRSALQLGTSNGHPGIWIAWALCKTDGKLTTVEVSSSHHYRALKSFQNAGLTKRVDAKLGDPEQLLSQLVGPFDFVFCDTEITWGMDFLPLLVPRIRTGGCLATYSTGSEQTIDSNGDTNPLHSLPDLRIEAEYASQPGITVGFKIAEQAATGDLETQIASQ